jgi:Domain of unknown function (DUF4267)
MDTGPQAEVRVGSRLLPSAIAVGTGAFLLGVGALLLTRPDRGGRLFGLGDAAGFARAAGLRQAYLGALVLGIGWSGRPQTLGRVLIGLGVIPVGDALIALRAGSGPAKAAEHLLGLLVVVAGASVLPDHGRRAGSGRPAEESRR